MAALVLFAQQQEGNLNEMLEQNWYCEDDRSKDCIFTKE